MRKTTLSLAKTKIKGVTFWQVTVPKVGGGRKRRTFKSKQDAQAFLELSKIQKENYGVAGASMDEGLRMAAIRAKDILQPLGLDLVDAAKHYATFIQSQVGGIPLSKAVEMFKKNRDIKKKSLSPSNGEKKTKKEEAEDYIYSYNYRKALDHYLKKFLEAFPNKTSKDITSGEIEAFLGERGALETIKTYRKTIKALFNFLVEEGYCDKNPVRKGKASEITYAVEILLVHQCANLLAACDKETLPSIAIGLFCGLRSSEIARLDWSKVNLAEKIIIVDAAVAKKTGSRRVVPIPAACKEWLTPYAKTEGLVQASDFRNKFDVVRVRAGFKPSFTERNDTVLQAHLRDAKKHKVNLLDWPSNCLRHSAISYALAESRDESKVASWAGNSPQMIKRHYDSQAMPSEAAKFYAILPERPKINEGHPPVQFDGEFKIAWNPMQ